MGLRAKIRNVLSPVASRRQGRPPLQAAALRRRHHAQPRASRPRMSPPKPIRRRHGRRGSRYMAGDSNRLTADWTTSPQLTDSLIYANLSKVRARSRWAARNEPIARRFLGMVVNNVVGAEGIKLISRAADGRKPDELARAAIEGAFADWAHEHCDLAGRLSWRGHQALAARTVALDGEALIEEVVGPDAGPYGYQLQALDPELLDTALNVDDLPSGGYIRMGVEHDAVGRPLAFWLKQLGGLSASLYGGGYHSVTNRRRVLADRIIHLFIQDAPGQTRGVPWMHAALYRLKQLSAYEDAAVVKARAGAMNFGVLTSPDGTPPEGDDEESDGSVISDLETGTIKVMREGYRFDSVDWQYPTGELEPFVAAIMRHIASGLEVSYNSLAQDLVGVSYSSIRQAVLDDRDVWTGLQAWLGLALCRRVFRRWLTMALTLGKITVPKNTGGVAALDPRKIDKYRLATFQGRRWGWVDPLKDMTANAKAVDINFKTVSELIRESGRDPDEVFAERAAELKRMNELGILPASGATDLAAIGPLLNDEGK